MPKRAAGGPWPASICGLGAWTGGRPSLWVRVGAAVAAAGYALTATFHSLSAVAPVGDQPMEFATVLVAIGAFLLAGRRPALAAGLLIGMVALELLVATARIPGAHTVTAIVLPVVVLGSGLFFGARAALASAALAGVLYPVALAISWRDGVWPRDLPPLDASLLVVIEFAVAAAGLLTWLVMRTLVGVHAEAEERRRLEIRLQHLQRLEVVGQLASVAAHDFRNVLGIFQNAASLLSTMKDPDARSMGADLLQTARSGQGITTRLLSLARREEPRRSVVDVARTVAELRPLVTRLIGPRCALDLRAEEPATALIDPAQVEQVVLNLVANARDAMAGAGRVEVRARTLPRGDARRLGSTLEAPRQVLLEVADHGPGIPPELHAGIFEPFVTTKPRGEGSGLGLATVRSIATGASGCVALESAPRAGASFRVFLPEEPAEAR